MTFSYYLSQLLKQISITETIDIVGQRSIDIVGQRSIRVAIELSFMVHLQIKTIVCIFHMYVVTMYT